MLRVKLQKQTRDVYVVWEHFIIAQMLILHAKIMQLNYHDVFVPRMCVCYTWPNLYADGRVRCARRSHLLVCARCDWKFNASAYAPLINATL